MQSPGRVVAIAVIQFVGAAPLVFAALIMAIIAVAGLPSGAAAPPVGRGGMFAAAGLTAAFAAWAIASGIGLLRLRRWALASTLLFGAGLVYGGLATAVRMVAQAPPLAPGIARAALAIDAALAAILLAIGLWWWLALAPPPARAVFSRPQGTGRPIMPLSTLMTVWLLVAGAAAAGAMALLMGPAAEATALAITLHGLRARWYYAVIGVCSLVIAAGLTRLRSWARIAAMALVVLTIINTVLTWVLPGAWARTLAARRIFPDQPLMQSFPALASSLAFGLGIELAVLYFLWTRKAAFLSPQSELAASGSELTPPLA